MHSHSPNTWNLKSTILCRHEQCWIKRLFWLNIMAWFLWTSTGFISRLNNVRVYVTFNLACVVSPVYMDARWGRWHTRTNHTYCAATLPQHIPIYNHLQCQHHVMCFDLNVLTYIVKNTSKSWYYCFTNLYLFKVILLLSWMSTI